MSLTIERRRSSSSRLDCSVSWNSAALRGRDSATCVPPIRLASGVRSSCATSALKPSSCCQASSRRPNAPLKAMVRSSSSTGRRSTRNRCDKVFGRSARAWSDSLCSGRSPMRAIHQPSAITRATAPSVSPLNATRKARIVCSNGAVSTPTIRRTAGRSAKGARRIDSVR